MTLLEEGNRGYDLFNIEKITYKRGGADEGEVG